MTLRTGVVGTGVVARNNHLPAVDRNPRTELVAVCDVDEESASDAATAYGCRRYVDAGTMVDQESLDWIHLATPVGTHLDLARLAVEAGVPVTLQKPATRSLAELEELRTLADDRGVPVSVVHNWLYYPVVRTVRRRIREGEVGALRAVEITVSGEGRPDETYRGSWVFDLAGGAFEEGLPHPLYLALAVGGYPRDADAIDARTRLAGDYDRDVAYDGASVQYETDDGTLCSVTALSGSARGTDVRVYGEAGSIDVDVPAMTVESRDPEEGPYHFPNERFRRNVADVRCALRGLANNARKYAAERVEEEFDLHRAESVDGHYYQLDRAARALQAGEQPPRDLEESYWTLLLVERIRASARDGSEGDDRESPAPAEVAADFSPGRT